MALAIGTQTMVSRPISFISMVISPKTAKAAETMAPEGYQEANKIEYKSEDLKDPFHEEKIEIEEQPEVQIETKPLPSVQIQGIVWGGSFPQAIINNKVVRVGDTIEGVRITDIDRNGVIVFFENRQYNLSTFSAIDSDGLKNNPNLRR
jgi:type II secretory pathway component PulC